MDNVLNEKFVSDEEVSDDEPQQIRNLDLGSKKDSDSDSDSEQEDEYPEEKPRPADRSVSTRSKERSRPLSPPARSRHYRSKSPLRSTEDNPRRRSRSPRRHNPRPIERRFRSPRHRERRSRSPRRPIRPTDGRREPFNRRRNSSRSPRRSSPRRSSPRRSSPRRSSPRRSSPRRYRSQGVQVLICCPASTKEETIMKQSLKRLGYSLYDHLEIFRKAAKTLIHQEKGSRLVTREKEDWVEPLALYLEPLMKDYFRNWGQGYHMSLFQEWYRNILKGRQVAVFGLPNDHYVLETFTKKGGYVVRCEEDLRLRHHAHSFRI